jgi:thiamine-phosphate pyrophosphorylase
MDTGWEASVARAWERGANWIQIREKDLAGGELAGLVDRVLGLGKPPGGRVLVNGRLDVALSCGADGCHFPAGWPPLRRFRRLVGADFLLGASCHGWEEVAQAEADGADYAFLSPVFATAGKGKALGLGELARICSFAKIPILALGGVTEEKIEDCVRSGAAGVAGIRLYQA